MTCDPGLIAHLRFQLFGLETEDQEALEAEVHKFKQACAALLGDPRRLEQQQKRKAAA